jgi:hypothetical protein
VTVFLMRNLRETPCMTETRCTTLIQRRRRNTDLDGYYIVGFYPLMSQEREIKSKFASRNYLKSLKRMSIKPKLPEVLWELTLPNF